MKLLTYQPITAGRGITNHGGNDGDDEQAAARFDYGADKGDQGSQHQRRRDEEHAGQRHMRVGVRDPVEDCVVLKQQLKAADIYAQSNDEQQEPNRDGEPAQGQRKAAAESSAESASATGDEDEQNGKDAGEHCQCKQPARNQFQSRQGEEIEVERPAEDGIGYAAGDVRRIPEQRQDWPLRLHRRAGRNGYHERNADGEQAKDGSNREIYRVSRDENCMIDGQVAGVRSLESGKCCIKNDECNGRKSREDAPLQAQCFPEHILVSKRPEPQQIDPIGDRGAAPKMMATTTATRKSKMRRRGRCGCDFRGQSIDSGIYPPQFTGFFTLRYPRIIQCLKSRSDLLSSGRKISMLDCHPANCRSGQGRSNYIV